MRRILCCFILIFLTSSCKFVYHRAPRYLKKKGYTFRYTSQPTGLSGHLNTNGYFVDVKSPEGTDPYRGYGIVFFFDDGMFVKCTHSLGPPGSSLEDNLRAMDSLSQIHKPYVYLNSRQEWGYYKVLGDTIKTQVIERPELGGSARFWAAYEIEFVIIDNNSLREVSMLAIHKPGPYPYKTTHTKYNIPEKKQWQGTFVPVSTTPSSNGWLKYEKWFWDDKSAFEKWLDSK